MEPTTKEASTNYSVTISMSQATVEALRADNFVLYGFKAVQSLNNQGNALVWFQTTNFESETLVSWKQRYQAYTTFSGPFDQIVTGLEIAATNSYDIELGNTLNVTSTQGTGFVDTLHGTPLAISIANQVNAQFIGGISQSQPDGSVTPLCAFPLLPEFMYVIAPIEQVLLTFSAEPLNPGTVIEQSLGDGLLIDLTGDNSRTVTFDIAAGWGWDGKSWAQQVPSNSNLAQLLIQSLASPAEST